ncbi:MAG TPA: HAD family hydrolase [Leptolyngbyaceae cyanobacterium M65_K2018_010]|nr:HAD family hydrolase [Leptolyngbyaceae cyanobacterium M65_K2018_010]
MIKLWCGGRPISAVEALVFDKDGTLANSHSWLAQLARQRAQVCVAAVQSQFGDPASDLLSQILASFGVRPTGLDPEGLMAVGTRQANQAAVLDLLLQAGYPAQGWATWVADLFDAADRNLAPKASHTPPFRGTQALLERLQASSLKVGVLSSDSPMHVEAFLQTYGLMAWVDGWQGTNPDDRPKPHPALLYRLCDRLAVSPQATVIVGDSGVDRQLALNAGAAGFISVSEAWGRPAVEGAEWVLTDWDDLQVLPAGPFA